MGFYSPRTLVNEARRMGISILPPDIHRSGRNFTVEDAGQSIRVGMRYTKHITTRALDSIEDARVHRPFASVSDPYARSAVQRDGLENLIRAGFLDTLVGAAQGGRNRLLEEVTRLPKKAAGLRSKGRQPELPLSHPASWWVEREGLAGDYLPPTLEQAEQMEWQALSLNVSRHPLAPYQETLQMLGVTQAREVPALAHGQRVSVAGMLESLQRPPTKSGKPVYFLMIEEQSGLLQCTIFRQVYKRYGHVLHHSSSYLLEGRVEQDDRRGFSFVVDRIDDLGQILARTPTAPSRTLTSVQMRTDPGNHENTG